MKKVQKIVAVILMLAVVMSICGGCKKAPVQTDEGDKTLTGTVSEIDSTVISVKTESGKTYHFALSGAAVENEGGEIEAGDSVIIYYRGELDESFDMQTVEIIRIVIGVKGDAASLEESSSVPESSVAAVSSELVASSDIADSSEPNQQNTEEPVTDKSVEEILSGMSIEEKVGQMFICRCPETDAAEKAAQYHVGGYILFAGDFKNYSRKQVSEHISSYQAAATVPMLIGVDEEGGTVTRISRYTQFRAVPFYSPQALFAEGGWNLVVSDTIEKAELLESLGLNVNFAPVCDVSTDPSDYIYKRSFGTDAKQTAQYVEKVISTMNSKGLGSVMKHFPGYGNNVDTHTGFSHDNRPKETFESSDFLPFAAGIKAGGRAILVSHNIVSCMDSVNPASLSTAVHDVLRNELNFDGVIMTDDLYMDAIKDFCGVGKAAVVAVQAGNDMLCCTDFEEQIPAVIDAVKDGTISEETINEHALRVLEWKKSLGLLN